MTDNDRKLIRLARSMGISAHRGIDGWELASWKGRVPIGNDRDCEVVLLSGVAYGMLHDELDYEELLPMMEANNANYAQSWEKDEDSGEPVRIHYVSFSRGDGDTIALSLTDDEMWKRLYEGALFKGEEDTDGQDDEGAGAEPGPGEEGQP